VVSCYIGNHHCSSIGNDVRREVRTSLVGFLCGVDIRLDVCTYHWNSKSCIFVRSYFSNILQLNATVGYAPSIENMVQVSPFFIISLKTLHCLL